MHETIVTAGGVESRRDKRMCKQEREPDCVETVGNARHGCHLLISHLQQGESMQGVHDTIAGPTHGPQAAA